MSVLLFLLISLSFTDLAKCANILGVFPAPFYSQFILGEKLMTELVKRGNNVTVISPFKPKVTLSNYTAVSTEGLIKKFQDRDLFKVEGLNFAPSIMGTQKSGLTITEYTLSETSVQNLIHSNASFDLVIVEQFFCEALMGFAKHYGAPLVIFSSIGPSEWNNNLMGNLNLPSYMPITKFSYTTRMSFFQRGKNSIAFLFDAIYKRYFTYPKQDEFLKKFFPKAMDLDEVMYNASLMLLNSHYSITDAFPLLPGMIEIGGFHIDPGTLPENLQKFLDDAQEGAIYFSMGTNLNASNLKENVLEDIVRVFSRLKQRVLWKYDKVLPHLPSNVLVAKWLPQNEILGHKNVKLFISHGGLLSMTESVHFSVPIVGIPIFGDQKMNIAKAERFGFALNVPYSKLSEETLYTAILTVLQDPKYTDNVKMRSRLYHDRPMKALDATIYWLEFVLRNRQQKQLEFAGKELTWYQFYLIDLLGCGCLTAISLVITVKCILRKLSRKQQSQDLVKKSKTS